MKIVFTEEKRGEIKRIQRQFKNQLSKSEIEKGTSQAINATVKRALPIINKEVKKEYNITQKHLSKIAKVAPYSRPNSLYAGISLSTSPISVMAFKPKQQGSGISVSIHKGKKVYIRSAFITTMGNGHKSVFAHGHYEHPGFIYGNEKTDTGKGRVTELKTASPFTMGTSQTVARDVQSFMGTEVLKRVEGILRSKVDKITRQ